MSEPQSHRHAPRGPIKAKDPKSAPDPMSLYVGGDALHGRVRCSAHSKAKGTQCGRTAIVGGTVCRYHGGAAPQTMAKAAQRIEALKAPAIAYLAYLLDQREYPSAGLGAAKDVLDRVDGKAAELVRVIASSEADFEALKAAQRQNAELARARLSEPPRPKRLPSGEK